jgi:ribosomal protein S18 acetylase RimI-like enzyme
MLEGRVCHVDGAQKRLEKMSDIQEYEQLVLETEAFRDIEMAILKEALLAAKTRPDAPTGTVEVRDGRILAGFGVVERAAGTDFTFEVLALVIDRGYAGKGIGEKLIELLEEAVLAKEDSAILRFETSDRKIEAMGKGLLPSCGYSLIGHIADFYEKGDGYYMYARHLARPKPTGGAPIPEPAVPTERGI